MLIKIRLILFQSVQAVTAFSSSTTSSSKGGSGSTGMSSSKEAGGSNSLLSTNGEFYLMAQGNYYTNNGIALLQTTDKSKALKLQKRDNYVHVNNDPHNRVFDVNVSINRLDVYKFHNGYNQEIKLTPVPGSIDDGKKMDVKVEVIDKCAEIAGNEIHVKPCLSDSKEQVFQLVSTKEEPNPVPATPLEQKEAVEDIVGNQFYLSLLHLPYVYLHRNGNSLNTSRYLPTTPVADFPKVVFITDVKSTKIYAPALKKYLNTTGGNVILGNEPQPFLIEDTGSYVRISTEGLCLTENKGNFDLETCADGSPNQELKKTSELAMAPVPNPNANAPNKGNDDDGEESSEEDNPTPEELENCAQKIKDKKKETRMSRNVISTRVTRNVTKQLRNTRKLGQTSI